MTDVNGDFTMNDVIVPYDVIITDRVSSGSGKIYRYFFRELSTEKLIFYLPRGGVNQHRICTIHFDYPVIDSIFDQVRIFFTDGDLVDNSSAAEYHILSVHLVDTKPVTGKLILLYYSRESGRTKFNKYAVKDNIKVESGCEYNITFSKDDLRPIPGISNVSGTITTPPGYTFAFLNKFYFKCAKRKLPNDANNAQGAYEEFSDNAFNFIIPTGLPFDFYPVISTWGATSPETTFRDFVLPVAGSGVELIINNFPVLLSPSNNSIDIDSNTIFSFSSSINNGIYHVIIEDSARNYYDYYSNKTSFDLKWMNTLNVNFSNSKFTWFVEYIGANDKGLDFLLNRDNPNVDYMMIPGEQWTFKTK